MTEQALNGARIEKRGIIIRGHPESAGALLQVKHQLQAGGAVDCFAQRLLQDQRGLEEMRVWNGGARNASSKSSLETVPLDPLQEFLKRRLAGKVGEHWEDDPGSGRDMFRRVFEIGYRCSHEKLLLLAIP